MFVVASLMAPVSARAETVAKLCRDFSVFAGANQRTVGNTTTYNRQASVQNVICGGFGSRVRFDTNGGIVCTLFAAAVGRKFEKAGTFIDGVCAAPEVAAEHDAGSRASQVCGVLSDLLGSVPSPFVKAYAAAASVSCALGKSFGGWIESYSERVAAQAVIRDQSRCLRFQTHHFPLTDQWDTVRCSSRDPGFTRLPGGPSYPPLGADVGHLGSAIASAAASGALADTAGGVTETSGGVTDTWTDYSTAGGSRGPAIGSHQTVDVACKLAGFRVADGDIWWYKVASPPWKGSYYASADAFYNNGRTSGSLLGTPAVDPAVPDCVTEQPAPVTAPASPTWSESTGGVAHTWTNYSNAGGVQGPSIPSNQTVQIACKLPGFPVADGDIWWYRIASAPWNGQFYVSADAFYNNGRSSGSLRGTPFVDLAVRDC